MLQLQHAATSPEVLTHQYAIGGRRPSDGRACWPTDAAAKLGRCLSLSAARRIGRAAARYGDPARSAADPAEMQRLALLFGHGNPDRLREQCLKWMADNRRHLTGSTASGRLNAAEMSFPSRGAFCVIAAPRSSSFCRIRLSRNSRLGSATLACRASGKDNLPTLAEVIASGRDLWGEAAMATAERGELRVL